MLHRSSRPKKIAFIALGLLLAGGIIAWSVMRRDTTRRRGESSSRPAVQTAANPFLPAGTPDAGWQFVRGPNFDGHSAEINLADSWPTDGPPILWVQELGQGYSGFVVSDDRVYTQYQTLAGQYVVCLDAESGETIWEYWYD
jgi:outer membrane protein assembly factor BamB